MGIALLQEQMVSYASRAPSETEQEYAQIEKELMAVVLGIERFQECLNASWQGEGPRGVTESHEYDVCIPVHQRMSCEVSNES